MNRNIIIIVIILILVITAGYMVWSRSTYQGLPCETFSNLSLNEVPVRCLEYFNIERSK